MTLRGIIGRYVIRRPRLRPEDPEFPFEGRITYCGITVDVENTVGSTRKGVDPDGNKWEVTMKAHYGEIRNTVGSDLECIDVYVHPNPNGPVDWVYVIHQVTPNTGKYDEDKVMLGFDSPNSAIKFYKMHYDSDNFFGSMTMMSLVDFKKWVENKEGPVMAPISWKRRK